MKLTADQILFMTIVLCAVFLISVIIDCVLFLNGINL